MHAYLRIRLNLKPPVAEMALASERVDGRAVVVSDLLLLSVVPHSHTDVVVACPTSLELLKEIQQQMAGHSPPDIKRKLESCDQDPLVYLSCSVTERMLA